MKAILYVGAVLMTGASIYGFVDLSKASKSKDVSNMYKDDGKETAREELKKAVPEEKSTTIEPKKELTVKSARTRKAAVRKDQPATATPITTLEKPGKLPVLLEKPEAIDVSGKLSIKENTNGNRMKDAKKKKKINTKMYSRARVG